MTCKCGSRRIYGVSAKCSDTCTFWSKNGPSAQRMEGYVPDDAGIGGGDYIEFSYCLDCGRIQGDFPLTNHP